MCLLITIKHAHDLQVKMGLLRILSLLMSNNTAVLLTSSARRGLTLNSRVRNTSSLHFYTATAKDQVTVFSAVSVVTFICSAGENLAIVAESTILFAASLLCYTALSLVRREVLQDVLLASLVSLIVCVDQSQRHHQDTARFNLACHVMTFMFALTGLRRSGLMLIWLLSETIRVTAAAGQRSWRQLLNTAATDTICLGYGLVLHKCIYYMGTEILRCRYRPRSSLGDLGTKLTSLEINCFTSLKGCRGSAEVPVLSRQEHMSVLLHMARVPALRLGLLQSLGEANARESPRLLDLGDTDTRRQPAGILAGKSTVGKRNAGVKFYSAPEIRVKFGDFEHPSKVSDVVLAEVDDQRDPREAGAYLSRRSRRANSLARRGNAADFLMGGNQVTPNESKPDSILTYFDGKGSIPLYSGRTTWNMFLPGNATEAVIQETNCHPEGSCPPVQISVNGRFADTKIERVFLAWRGPASTRLFFVASQWLLAQQVCNLLPKSFFEQVLQDFDTHCRQWDYRREPHGRFRMLTHPYSILLIFIF